MTFTPYPLLLAPSYMNYLWGGDRIPLSYRRSTKISPCAESWEVSDRIEGPSQILNGNFKNQTLKEVIEKAPYFFNLKKKGDFPLLIKLIDAKKSLSIQVHPDEEKAAILNAEPKTEAWHILDAAPGSFIYLGLSRKLSNEQLKRAIETHTLEVYLNKIEVQPGQTFYIPAGLIHSIGAGCLIYEVQQNSNTTYRLYDWGRVGMDGKQRPLHLQEALKALAPNQSVAAFKPFEVLKTLEGEKTQLVSSPFFKLFKWALKEKVLRPSSEKMRHLFVTKGALKVRGAFGEFRVQKGQSLLIPIGAFSYSISPIENSCEILETLT